MTRYASGDVIRLWGKLWTVAVVSLGRVFLRDDCGRVIEVPS
jgi:hypothetical protein